MAETTPLAGPRTDTMSPALAVEWEKVQKGIRELEVKIELYLQRKQYGAEVAQLMEEEGEREEEEEESWFKNPLIYKVPKKDGGGVYYFERLAGVGGTIIMSETAARMTYGRLGLLDDPDFIERLKECILRESIVIVSDPGDPA
jgi:hypothetical protein